jgi:LytS/YehU family sensor histidine kinase
VSFIGLGLVLSVIKLSVSDFIFYSAFSPEFIGSKGILSIRFLLVNTKDMSFIVALFVIAKFSKDWMIAEKQHQILQKKYAELNLKLLQSHFEPHFLFNTLNNLYALSLSNLDKTLEVLRKFKRVLQFAIIDAQLDKVLLKNEIEMIQDYALIEQIRYGSRLHLKNTVDGEIKHQVIAPFILFSLVENCFKHGSSHDAGSPWIELYLNCQKNKLYFEAKNSIPKRSKIDQLSDNQDIIKLRKRLELIYPRKCSLIVQQKNQEFIVKLDLELS